MAAAKRTGRGKGPASLTVVTWNTNSVRLRVPHLQGLVEALAPDVICLQETKTADPTFPLQAFADLGFPHAALHGANWHSGTAILSRLPFASIDRPLWCDREDGRHVIARLAGGIEINCVYVPSGGPDPDPVANPRFAHKLRFLGELAAWFAARKRPANRLILAGDLNVAPLPTDVWSHKQLLNVVSHTPVEVAALADLQRAHDWIDAVRTVVPEEQKLYTWWSYRALDWEASNRGRRLDHIWVTPPLRRTIAAARVLREARDWDPPSDHVPVAVTLALAEGAV